MLQDFFISPQVFDIENLENSELNEYILKEFLNAIEEVGYITAPDPYWYKEVLKSINTLSTHSKRSFKKIISELKKRGTIISHTLESFEPRDENDWIKISNQLEYLQKFNYLLITNYAETIKVDKTLTLNILNKKTMLHKVFCNKGITIHQTEEEVEAVCTPLLSYAQIVRLYDPYFDIVSYKNQKGKIIPSRFLSTLNIMCRLLYSHRDNTLVSGERGRNSDESRVIIIHTLVRKECSKRTYGNPKYKENYDDYVKTIKNELNKLTIEYKHKISIYLWDQWEDKTRTNWKKRNAFHDRFITTEKTCIQVGNGLDISQKESAWSIIEKKKKGELEKEFDEHDAEYNTPYELVEIIISD